MIRIRQKEVFWRSLKNYTCTESKKDLATFNLLISNMYSLAFLPFSVLILFLTLTFFLSWTLSVSSFFFTFSSPASAVQLASLKFFPLVKCWHTPDYAAMMDFNYLPFSPASHGPKVTLTDVGGLPWVGLPCKTETLSFVRCLLFMLWIPWAHLAFRNELYLNTMEKFLLPKLGWVSHCEFQKNKIGFYLLEMKKKINSGNWNTKNLNIILFQ